jgi:hypothetical protein
MISAAVISAKAQSGATSLTGLGFGIEATYLPSSHYIRPEDSLKMPASSGIRRALISKDKNGKSSL